jgi:AcrR family transcriptional regulator
MTQPPIGRRERKKAQTRKALADAALRLFLEKGFANVTVADVAEAADVSVTTLFKYFPSKEALIFDEDNEREEALAAVITNRAPGQSILAAMYKNLVEQQVAPRAETPYFVEMRELVAKTPVLMEYFQRMWMRHTETLATVIAADVGVEPSDVKVQALVRFMMEAPRIAAGHPEPDRALREVFELLETGWGEFGVRDTAAPSD